MTDPAAHFELPLPTTTARTPDDAPVAPRRAEALSAPLLARNAGWFCQLRWLAIALLAAFGVVGLIDSLMETLGLRAPGIWPFVAAGVLTVSNTFFGLHARAVRRHPRLRPAKANLWGQIIVDLVVLTAVVHFIGSAQTYVAFTYLFHIALACIFFPRRESLLVTLLAGGLYAACMLLERYDVLAEAGIFARAADEGAAKLSAMRHFVSVASAVAIWLVVWYLVSQLSTLVRRRDVQLAMTNERLLAALEERRQHMLVTTHELKAPFAAIHANAQLLRDGYCGELPDKAMDVLERITARCHRLTAEIQEMLQLANLTSTSQGRLDAKELDLAELLQWAISQAAALAQERSIQIDSDLQPARTTGVTDHIKMLLGNLVTNAVIYSNNDGRVSVTCRVTDTGVEVTIADQGIGIAADKLPHIFEEHYRTSQAVQHNRASSGLGLAIVRQVAEDHRIGLRVESQLGVGTTFRLEFTSEHPPAG